MDSVFWVREFRREEVPDFVMGQSLKPRRISPNDMLQLEASKKGLLGLWRTVGEGKLSPLPQVILGELSTLEDLVAWTAAYVPGLCPLSRLTRLMTPSDFQKWRNRGSLQVWEKFAGGAVGLMFGEVMSYAHFSTDLRTIDADMCRSTLSYALLRCNALGGKCEEIRSITDDWVTLRQRAGLFTKKASCELIFNIVVQQAESPESRSVFGTDVSTAQKAIQELFGKLWGNENTPLGEEIWVGSTEESSLSAEKRVRIFDEMVLIVADDRSYSASQRGLILAQLAIWCRRGLANQWAILQPFQTRFPECAIWLGALQAKENMADSLSVGRAVGWRLALELLEDIDLFSAPDEDVSFFELNIGQSERQWRDVVSATNRARVKVGIAPGVSTLLRVNGSDDALQREFSLGVSFIDEKMNIARRTAELKRLHRSLELALRDLKNFLQM